MTKIITDEKQIDELLSRGVLEVINQESLRKDLLSGKQLRIKFGTDPTSPNIHIGRAVTLLKLKDFQDLGHQIVFIIGDMTGTIGDTSDKEAERPMLSQETVNENLKTYIDQVGKILDISKVEIRKNSEWLNKLNFADIGELANHFSVAEFISRDNIRRRLDDGSRVSLRELLYPLMQGYDSVALKADVELGGLDQRFNLLAGRTLQEAFGQKPQNIIMNPIIEGLDGRKMSSSYGNSVNLLDAPTDMFTKIMRLDDALIAKYFLLCTRVDLERVEEIKKRMHTEENPRNLKIELAQEIVRMYHGEAEAKKAVEYFVSVVSEKNIPDDIPSFKLDKNEWIVEELVIETKLIDGNTEARRLIDQNAVKLNGNTLSDRKETITVKNGDVLQIGKKKYIRFE